MKLKLKINKMNDQQETIPNIKNLTIRFFFQVKVSIRYRPQHCPISQQYFQHLQLHGILKGLCSLAIWLMKSQKVNYF